jgi:hypothetical protein
MAASVSTIDSPLLAIARILGPDVHAMAGEIWIRASKIDLSGLNPTMLCMAGVIKSRIVANEY